MNSPASCSSGGLWLVLLEFTLVSFAWYLNFRFELGLRAQVIWAIGVSMIALAGLDLPSPLDDPGDCGRHRRRT